MPPEEYEKALMEQMARDCEAIFAAHGVVPAEPTQNFFYTGPPGPQPTLEDVALLRAALEQHAADAAVQEKVFEDGWLGPEADDAAFLRSLGIEP
jgi:protoheme ferro-lyase